MESIRRNLPALVSQTNNVEQIGLRLYALKIMSSETLEMMMSKPTNSGKCMYLYTYMMRRPKSDVQTIVEILKTTGNSHLAEEIEATTSIRKRLFVDDCLISATGPPEKKKMFDGMIEALKSISPVEIVSERSNLPLYKVSVDMYSGQLPRSTIGLKDLPYLIALNSGYSKQSVQSWDGCPMLLSVVEEYEEELESAKEMVKALAGCAVFISSKRNPAMEKALKALEFETDPFIKSDGYDPEESSEGEKKRIAMILHLTTYGLKMTVQIRKDFAPKPSSYLLMNPFPLSDVVKPRDRQIVLSIAGSDESNTEDVEPLLAPCPF